MSEPKRVTLNTISTTVSSGLLAAGSARFGAEFLAPADKTATPTEAKTASKTTIRLKIQLFETDSSKYPEFNYAKLLHLEKKKIKKLKQKSNGFSSADPFEDNDDDVARIAKELEKKYGTAYSSGRGKSKRDDVDIGMGYDESDSFIDNTEAYDELIPDEVETIEGGFYINCGALEFKKLHTESFTTKTDEIIKMPDRPRKRVISSSSEDSSSSGDDDDDDSEDDDDDDDSEEEGSSAETAKSKSNSANTANAPAAVDKIKKSSASSTISTTTNPSKKKAVSAEENGSSNRKKIKKTNALSCSSSNSPKPHIEEIASDSERERNVKKLEKTTTVKDMLKAQRDNFLKSQSSSDVKSSNGSSKGKKSSDEDNDNGSSSSGDSDEDDSDDSDDNSDSNQSAAQSQNDGKTNTGAAQEQDNQGSEKLRTADTKLPDLEPECLAGLQEFKTTVQSQNMTGKKFQFNDKLTEMFLKIDDFLLCMEKPQRNMVFAHLEYNLLLPKYFFLRKAKQLRIKEEKLKSKKMFNKLHRAVTEMMPAIVANYEAELRKFAELQSNPAPEQILKMPKKKFPWNNNLRNLLYDVYQTRWTSYPVLGTRKETLEEFINVYMREKVLVIWPKGWMRYEEIQKEIEKRKTAAKKAKDKKKAISTTTSSQASPNPNIAINTAVGQTAVSTTVQLSNLSTNTTAAAATSATSGSSQATPSYIKQFEEFATKSNANSDTESVASSNTSSGLKRKNTDGPKATKIKTAKLLNGEQVSTTKHSKQDTATHTVVTVDVVSPHKRTDHSINHLISPTSLLHATTATSTVASTSASAFSATTAAVSQPLQHSTNAPHIIDLDNYKCVGDIIQTSKQLQAAAAAPTSSSANSLTVTKQQAMSSLRRESSGDSEIEIIGVFPPTKPNTKQKTRNSKSRSATPNNANNNNNNNNINNNKNLKKTATHAATLPSMDVNKMVNTLMELGDVELQIKPVLSSATAAQQSGAHQ